MDLLTSLGVAGLFIAGFLAATFLPLSSELVLVALLTQGLSPWLLVAVATAGNVLGSVLNYVLGYWANQGVIQRYKVIPPKRMAQAEAGFAKYGLVSLCFTWVPGLGDALTLLAGILRVPWYWFVPLVTLGKLARYCVIAYLTLAVGA